MSGKRNKQRRKIARYSAFQNGNRADGVTREQYSQADKAVRVFGDLIEERPKFFVQGNAGQGLAGIPVTQTGSAGEIIADKSGILLALNGMGAFQKKLAFGENRRRGRPNFRRDGMPVTDEGVDKTAPAGLVAGTRYWVLSDLDSEGKLCKNFCPDCGSNNSYVKDVFGTQLKEPAPGLTMISKGLDADEDASDFEKTASELDKAFFSFGLRPGDCLVFWICAQCMENMMQEQEKEEGVTRDPDAPILLDQYGNDLGAEHENRSVDQYLEDRSQRCLKNSVAWIQADVLKGGSYRVVGGGK